MALLSGPPVHFSGNLPVSLLEVPLSIGAAIASVLRQYATFSGRARRSEYWWYSLAYAIVSGALTGVATGLGSGSTGYSLVMGLSGLVSLALLLPTLAVFVRRMHDTNRSGFWFFLGFVPLVGGIILLVWTILPGTVGPNRFGEDPKAVATSPAPATV